MKLKKNNLEISLFDMIYYYFKYRKLDIVGVAIKTDDEIYIMTKPNRHDNIIDMVYHKYNKIVANINNKEQGFILSNGLFVNRIEAAKIACVKGVFIKTPPKLFSEDLW